MIAKTDRVTKLYDKLTAKELASLTFSYLAEANEVELDRVAGAVPQATYRCIDADFRRWFDGFVHLASFCGIEALADLRS